MFNDAEHPYNRHFPSIDLNLTRSDTSAAWFALAGLFTLMLVIITYLIKFPLHYYFFMLQGIPMPAFRWPSDYLRAFVRLHFSKSSFGSDKFQFSFFHK